MEMKEECVEALKKNSFQKTERIDFAFWHGKNRVLNTLLEREKTGDQDLMRFPQIEEEEIVSVIGKMKMKKPQEWMVLVQS